MMRLTAAMNFDGTAATAAPTGFKDAAYNTVLENGSTSSLFAAKKSTPKMGLATAARRKEQKNVLAPKHNFFVTFPHEAIPLPSAPLNGGPLAGKLDL